MTSPETPPNKGEGHSADADVSRRLGRVANEEIILTEEAKRIIIEGPVRRLEEKRKKAEEEKDKLAAEEAAKAAAEAAAKAAAEAKGAKPIEDAPAPAPAPEAPAAPAPEAPAAPAPEAPTPEEDTKPDAETSGPRREAKKKSRFSTAFAAFLLAALILITSKIPGGNPAEAKKESPTNLPPDRPAAGEVLPTKEASYSFEESGHVNLADGQEVTRYVYSGGYHSENDPYYTKFDHKDEPDYENDDAYGFQIEGDTPAEKTTNWVKNVMLSPEAIIRLRVQMGLESLDSIEQENNRANELRRMSPEEYDRIANETATAF